MKISSRSEAVRKLKELLKPRRYYLHLFDNYHIIIIAEWVSDTSVDISVEYERFIPKNKKKNLLTLEQIKCKLSKFHGDILEFCDQVDRLAVIEKIQNTQLSPKEDKDINIKITVGELASYFGDILYDAEQ